MLSSHLVFVKSFIRQQLSSRLSSPVACRCSPNDPSDGRLKPLARKHLSDGGLLVFTNKICRFFGQVVIYIHSFRQSEISQEDEGGCQSNEDEKLELHDKTCEMNIDPS
jgi:hypothetical protein